MAEFYERVQVCFEPDTEMEAEIVINGNEMVIDSLRDADYPHLIRGRRVEGYFAGRNEDVERGEVDVIARWAKLGDVWVGYWCEEGEEYLFSFRLPKRPSRKSAGDGRKYPKNR
jgi:hypothetical protein